MDGLHWRFFQYIVTSPTGKKRKVSVYTPFAESALFGVAAAEDETVEEKELGELDRSFQIYTTRKSARPDELVDFYAGFLKGMELNQGPRKALELVMPMAKTPFFRGVISSIYLRLKEGDQLSDAMSLFPQVFDRATLALVKAGEMSGNVAPILSEVSKANARTFRLVKKAKGGMMYPLFVLGLAMVVVILMAIVVMPKMTENYEAMNVKLPILTEIFKQFSELLIGYPWALAIPIVLFVVLKKNWGQIKNITWFQNVYVRLPIVGSVLRGIILVRCLRALGLLMRSGVKVSDALTLAGEISGHNEYQKFFEAIHDEVINHGKDYYPAFRRHYHLVPVEGDSISRYMKLAQSTGSISGVFLDLADNQDQEVNSKAENLPRLIEPILLLFVIGLVGGIVAAIYLPFFVLIREALQRKH